RARRAGRRPPSARRLVEPAAAGRPRPLPQDALTPRARQISYNRGRRARLSRAAPHPGAAVVPACGTSGQEAAPRLRRARPRANSMQIESVETAHYRIPLPAPVSDSTHGELRDFELIVCRASDASGLEGLGYTYTLGRGGTGI